MAEQKLTVEQQLNARYQTEINAAKLDAARTNIALQQEAFNSQEEKSMVKDQLDLTEEISRIDYLIKGYSLEPNKDGKLVWIEPTDKDMIIFSEYGIHLIRNTICWYLNKNLLLSNFDEETIKKKMWDFTNDLIDTIFMEYDKVFLQPTVDDCINVLKERIARKVKISMYALDKAGKKANEKDLINEKFAEIEDRIEDEIDKIKQTLIKNKLKRYVLIVRTIQDAIHATFMRAWKGQERATLRQHVHISENRGINPQQQNQGGIWPWAKK